MQIQCTESQTELTDDLDVWKRFAAVQIEAAVRALRQPDPSDPALLPKARRQRREARRWLELRAPELLEWIVPTIDNPDRLVRELLAEYDDSRI